MIPVLKKADTMLNTCCKLFRYWCSLKAMLLVLVAYLCNYLCNLLFKCDFLYDHSC